MLRNYLKIAFRSLTRNTVYSSINIGGLAIGLACSILILLWVNDELSYDRFHEHHASLYKVMLNSQGDNGINTQEAAPLPLAEELKNDPDIKFVTTTDWGGTPLLTTGDKKLYKTSYYAGADFLKMFSFKLVEGDQDKQLSNPSSMVISESTAKAFFGSADAIGKIIRVNNTADMTVTGVMEDVPANSTFRMDVLLPFSRYEIEESWVKQSRASWGNNAFNLYVQFTDQANPSVVETRVKNLIKTHSTQKNEVTFFAMDRWRLYQTFENGRSTTGTIVYVRIFSIIAIFILVIACINFMNLATARSERRAREVGIRKSIGSQRKELIAQFMGETFLITFIAAVLSIAFVEAALPFYNHIVNKNLSIDFSNPLSWGIFSGVILVTTLLAGSYPSFYLSSFKPASVLKGKVQMGKSGSLPRKAMVTLQFFFSIGLIIATIVVYQQMQHLRNRPTGYNRENVVLVENIGDISTNFRAIKQELFTEGIADNITTSSSPITSIYAYMDADWPGKREDQHRSIAYAATGLDYTKTLGMHLKEGRDFSESFNDSTSMILNQAAVDYMELKNPLNELITYNGRKFRVVGIIDNVLMASASKGVDPMMFTFNPDWVSDVTVRLSSSKDLHDQLAGLEKVFKKHNPAYPFSYRFADAEFEKKFTNIELLGSLADMFAFLAIMISCLGLFGLAAFTAEQRTKEIGIRKVLGASVSAITILLSGDFTKLVIIAFALATPLTCWALQGWLSSHDYHIKIQWWVPAFAGVFTLLLSVTTVIFQAIKAAVADPVKSLRNE